MKEVFRQQPETLKDLGAVVEDFAKRLSPDVVRASVSNLRIKAEYCLTAERGHFVYFMKSI